MSRRTLIGLSASWLLAFGAASMCSAADDSPPAGAPATSAPAAERPPGNRSKSSALRRLFGGRKKAQAAASEAEAAAQPTSAPADAKKREEQLAAEESLARFQQILAKRPLHGPAFVGLVKLFAEQGRLDDLVKDYEQKVKALPDQPALQIVLARVYSRVGKPQKAAEIIDKIAHAPSGNADDESKLLIFKSEVYQQTGRNDAAREMLEQALAQARTVSERLKLTEALADLYIRSNDPKQAAAVLRKLAAAFPDNYLHRKRVADDLAQRELNQDAVTEYRELLKNVAKQADQRVEVLRQLGRTLEKLEKRDEAIEAYSQAVGMLSAGHWLQKELHDRIVTLYRASGRLDDLVKYCRRELERAPEQTSMRALLADVLVATGDTEGAKKTLTEAVQLFPKDRGLSEKRIQLLDRLNDSAGVAAEYERIVAQIPDEVELYIAYGQFLATNKQLEAARNQWKHVLNRDLTDAGMAQRLGALFEPYELYDDAQECYERAIKLSPTRADGYVALSRLFLFRGQKDKARDALRRLAQANPNDAATQATLCQALLNLGQTDEALAAIVRACELDPKQVNYRLNHADVLVAAGRATDALKVRREAIDLINNPGQLITAMDVLVSMYGSTNQLKALREAEEARLKENPKNTLSMLLLARAADFDRQFAQSRDWLNKLLEVEPANEEGLRQLAKLHEAVGDLDAATESYRKLSELFPARARQYFQAVADLKLRYSDRRGAIEFFDKMVQSAPGNATVLKSVAEQLIRLEEFDKAIALYEQALKVQPDFAEVRLAYGKALQDAGRQEDALTAFRAAALQRTDRDTAIDAMGRLYDIAGELGKVDELLADLQSRVESNPDDTLTAQLLSELLVREFEYARANEMLETVLRHHPRDAGLQMERADILRRLAKFDESIDGYRGVLRLPNADRDFVLGELGKAYFEAGKIDLARTTWRQIGHKIYAGSLLRNNGLLDDAIETLREGIRLKPDDFGLHRNLIATLQAAGKVDESLEAARRLLDLEPDNIFNIQAVAKAYLDRGDRASAADVASRLFSAGVVEKKDPTSAGKSRSNWGGMSVWAMSVQSGWSGAYGGGGSPQNNLDRAVQFFQENGLLAELEETLTKQVESQPKNALLKQRAAELCSETFGKPEAALALYKELETAAFPLEHQDWLGQCSQRDHMRIRQYQLIGSKPGLRDKRLAELEPRGVDKLSRDETIELAVIWQSQGNNDKAVELLQKVTQADASDVVALSMLIETLQRAERYKDAEAPTVALVQLLGAQRERVRAETLERVRRDFVRTLPMQQQLHVTDDLLGDIADKWTLGQAFVGDYTGFAQVMGYFRAQLALATIYAKTDRIDKARAIWKELEPKNAADADGWTMLAGVAQLHEQNDLAYAYYEKALGAAKKLAEDPLLQRIYSSTLANNWYGGEAAVDSSFNKIVEAFAGQKKLVELYDFLRETDQTAKARRVAEQYKLYDELKRVYTERFEDARKAFRQSSDNPLQRSVPVLMAACKLAELSDQTGDWAAALKVYEEYLTDFPDELGLLITLSEAAEAQDDFVKAIEWEKKALATKERLNRRAREWAMRQLPMTPAPPQVCRQARTDNWSWQQRWGKNSWWGYGSQNNPLEVWPSWMRVAQLYLSLDNSIASADAMERAVGSAGMDRSQVAAQLLEIIQQRQLSAKMLPVLRSLAVFLPTDEKIQLAFAESLEANKKPDVASEVYKRMLRRGVSDIGALARVRDKLKTLQPKGADEVVDTMEGLEAAVKADPNNANALLRLAKAQYYSLNMDAALENLLKLQKTAPHLEGLHDLLIEIYTLRGDSPALIESLRAKIKRSTDDEQKRSTRWRLIEELLSAGKDQEALTELKDAVDPKDPGSYERVGMLLHYFGKHDEAVKQFQLAGRSRNRQSWDGEDSSKIAVARAMVLKGDIPAAADKIMEAVAAQAREATQFGGMSGIYAMYDNDRGNPFESFVPLFILRPALLDAVRDRLVKAYDAKPDDPQAARQLMQLYQRTGRPDLADGIMEKMTSKAASDQRLVMRQIDRAVKQRKYDAAAKMASKWIEQQPKTKLPPGMPAQFAGMMMLMSPRNQMICKLGDIYWKMDQKDKAFETYHQIVDEQVDESRLAYAAICSLRGRQAEALKLVDDALAAQKVRSPSLLQFRAMIAASENQPEKLFDLLADAAEIGAGQQSNPYSFSMDGQGNSNSLLDLVAARTGLIDRYAEFLKKQIAKNPNDWNQHDSLATLYYNNGRTDEAFAVLDEAEKVKSLRRDVLQQRIAWIEGFSTPDELIPIYEKLIKAAERKVKASSSGASQFFGSRSMPERQADSQPLRDRLGNLLWQQGKQDAAIKVWTERMNLESAASQISLGRRLLGKEARDKAEQAFRKAVDLEPGAADAHEQLADLDVDKGDLANAREHLKEAFLRRLERTDSSDSRQDFYDSYSMNRRADPTQSLREIAFRMLQAGEADASKTPPDADSRLAISILGGDWTAAESLLKDRLAAAPYDPVVWRLWAKLQERKGQWAEAATAWETVRRIEGTTISEHRDRLKLVLAGKHIKEAAAGSKTAGAAQQQMQQAIQRQAQRYSGQYGRYYYGQQYASDNTRSRLAELYVKTGQSAKAERLYLVSSEGDVSSALPFIAGLMWRQGDKKRAGEIALLGALLSSDTSELQEYAGLLAESGSVDDAIDLIVRSYRCRVDQESNSPYAGMNRLYGYYSQQDEDGNGNWQDQATMQSLRSIARRGKAFDGMLTRLAEESRKSPEDERLAMLVRTLQIQEGRWKDALESVNAARKLKPEDESLLRQCLAANLQLENWDTALEVLAELRKLAPENDSDWRLNEAFVRLMQDKPDEAVAAVQPLLDKPVVASMDRNRSSRLISVLAAAGKNEALRDYLKRLADHEVIDVNGRAMLVRLEIQGKSPEKAAQLAAEQLWRQPDCLNGSSPWLACLGSAVAAAGSAPTWPDMKPEDKALLTMVAEGPTAGAEAFGKLVSESGDNLSAKRGLVLALTLDGKADKAAAANRELLDWLAPRRNKVWYAPPQQPVGESAAAFLDELRETDLDAQSVLGFTMSFTELLRRMLGESARYGSDQTATGPMRYEVLWMAHEHNADDLLAAAGDVDHLSETLRLQSELADGLANRRDGGQSGRRVVRYMTNVGGSTVTYYSDGSSESSDGDNVQSDWRLALRQLLSRYRLYESLESQLQQLGPRINREDAGALSELYATLGRAEDAKRWRARRIDQLVGQLKAADEPSLSSSNDRYNWWRPYRYLSAEDLQRLQGAMRRSVNRWSASEPDRKRPFEGAPDELWELALVDPDAETKLVAMAASVGPAWGETQTFNQLLRYYVAKEKYADALTLIEKAYEPEQLLLSTQFGPYLSACVEAGDWTRYGKALDQIAERGAGLENTLRLMRLMALRHQKKAAEADQLERELVADCSVARPNPIELNPWITSASNANRWSSGMNRDFAQYASYGGAYYPMAGMGYGEMATLAELAGAVGAKYRMIRRPDDLTLREIAETYALNGLYEDAARLLADELKSAGLTKPSRRRARLLASQADYLGRGGQNDKARPLVEELVAYWEGEAQARPFDPAPYRELETVYNLKACGPDREKAYRACCEARSRSKTDSRPGLSEAEYLFRLGRYEDAWAAYRAVIARGLLADRAADAPQRGNRSMQWPMQRASAVSNRMLYQAGLSARRAGDKTAAEALLRQAQWRDPNHPLAREAQELTRE